MNLKLKLLSLLLHPFKPDKPFFHSDLSDKTHLKRTTMNFIFILIICFLQIVLTLVSETKSITCDVKNCTKCENGMNSFECKNVCLNCLKGYHEWPNFSLNQFEIEVDPESNFEIIVQPKYGAMKKNLIVIATVRHCNSTNCNTYRQDFETNYTHYFENGN
jgi:hypothetical protein